MADFRERFKDKDSPIWGGNEKPNEQAQSAPVPTITVMKIAWGVFIGSTMTGLFWGIVWALLTGGGKQPMF